MRVRQACWGLKTITYHKSSQESKGGGQMTLWSFDRKDVFIIDQVLPSSYHPVLLLRLPTWVRISHSFEEAVTMSSLKIPKSLPVFPPFTWSETPIHMTFAKSATAIIPVLFSIFVWRNLAGIWFGLKVNIIPTSLPTSNKIYLYMLRCQWTYIIKEVNICMHTCILKYT